MSRILDVPGEEHLPADLPVVRVISSLRCTKR
jgi:hypothetical protein